MRITQAIAQPCNKRFQQMLKAGSFPKVNFKVWDTGKSYNMIEYSVTWARFMKCVDKLMDKEIDPDLGAFTRKHSKIVLDKLQTLLEGITEADVNGTTERFKTMWD